MSDADSSRVLSTLIGSIYDSALEPEFWEKTLFRIRDVLDTQSATLSLSGLRHDRLPIAKVVGEARNWIEQQQRYVSERGIELGGLPLPHLRPANTTSDVLDARGMKRALMAEALDALRCGVVLTNEHATILHANRSAEEMLRDGGSIQGKRGVLTAKAPEAAKKLHRAIQLATTHEKPLGKTEHVIRLTAPDVPPVLAHVLPIPGSDERPRLHSTAVAAVFVGAPADEHGLAGTMAAVYGLTPAETRVLVSLLAGRTLNETARLLNIAVTTAKTHLKNIFAKTGVTRQAELMLLASRVSSPGRSAS